jgi:hypothetical protein
MKLLIFNFNYMVRNYFRVLIVLLAVVIFYGCEKKTIDFGTTVKPRNASTDTVHFATQIIPIFTSNCNGCHNSQTPILEPGVAYADLNSGGYINVADPEESLLYEKLHMSTSTHASKSTPAQQDLILQWITQGAKNN